MARDFYFPLFRLKLPKTLEYYVETLDSGDVRDGFTITTGHYRFGGKFSFYEGRSGFYDKLTKFLGANKK
jgi:hypothetical protein